MKVLVVYAHPNPQSFNHAVLESFTKGLKDGGHTVEVVDLHAIKFHPALKLEDFAQFTGGQMPQDVLDQQEKVSQADALAFIYPVIGYYWPTILVGYITRVFSFGFAWKADEKGMEGLLGDMKTLSIGTTGFSEEFYKTTGVGDAVNKLIGTVFWSFGIQTYEIVNLYGVQIVDDETRKNYLEQVYRLGKEF